MDKERFNVILKERLMEPEKFKRNAYSYFEEAIPSLWKLFDIIPVTIERPPEDKKKMEPKMLRKKSKK